MRVIQGKKGRDKYYYDSEKMTVSDKDGNVIHIRESLDGVDDSVLSWELDLRFHLLYKSINEMDSVISAFKRDKDIVESGSYDWSGIWNFI